MAETRGLPPAAGRTINPALFLVAVICFFLPFFTVECSSAIPEALEGLAEGLGEDQDFNFGDQQLSQSVSGWQLVVGDAGEQTGAPGTGSQVEDPGPDWIAVAAVAVAVLGVGLSWLRRPLGPALAILLGIAGSVLLVMLWRRIAGRIPPDAQPFVELRTEPAFWVSVVTAGLAALWGALRLFLEPGEPRAAPRELDRASSAEG